MTAPCPPDCPLAANFNRQLAELQAEHRREIEDKELQIAVLIAQLCPTQVDARKH